MFDVFYIGDNPSLVDEIPFAKQVDSADSIVSLTKMFWLVMPDTEILDYSVFDFRPESHDQVYTHVWKWTNNSYGGLLLVPATKTAGYKPVSFRACTPRLRLTYDSPDEFFEQNPTSQFVWVIDTEYEYSLPASPSWAPDFFDDYFIYKFWLPGYNTYDYGSISLCPRNYNAVQHKYVNELTLDVEYSTTDFPITYLSAESDIIEQLVAADTNSTSSMFWAVDPYITVHNDFRFDYCPAPWDQGFVHVFQDHTGKHNSIRLYPKGTFLTDASISVANVVNNSFTNLKYVDIVASKPSIWPVVKLATFSRDELVASLDQCTDPFMWTIDPDVTEFSDCILSGYTPSPLTSHKVSVWQRLNPNTSTVHSYGGLRLWPTNIDRSLITTDTVLYNKIKTINYVRAPGCEYKPYDIVFISNNEPYAHAHLARLKEKNILNEVLWVNGADDIFSAHKEAAELAQTKMFWVVDGDAEVLDTFDFSYVPNQYDQDVVHVWHSINPVTNAEYGYGGVKLFNRAQILNLYSWGLDFTTGVSNRFKVMTECSCVTRFNTDSFAAWRSAFRECVKLLVSDTVEAKRHFETWQSINSSAAHAADVKQGVVAAIQYVSMYKNKVDQLAKINDFNWLRDYYDSTKHVV